MASTEKSISISKFFIEKINKSKRQSKNGKLETIETKNLWGKNTLRSKKQL